MPVKRNLWRSEISDTVVPDWPCPNCHAATLSIIEDSIKHEWHGALNRYESASPGAVESSMAEGYFVCFLQCKKTGCEETLAVLGWSYLREGCDEDGNSQAYYVSRPTTITPPPPMIEIPEACPAPIRHRIESAFSLFWCDPASSLNSIRGALELMLDDLLIHHSPPKESGKEVRRPLHSRIEELEKRCPKFKERCDRMMAVKHLGNAGSHSDIQVVDDDVFDAFDILEQLLEDVYSTRTSDLAESVRQIIEHRGPRKRQ